MATARWFARSRVVKLAVALCIVSALAFLLGQGVAAFRTTLTQAPTAPPQVIERVSGAQGTTPPPAATPAASTASSRTAQSGTAAPLALSAALTHAAPAQHAAHARGKDKPHAKHKEAAGDSSHGGLAHSGDASQSAQQHGNHGDGHNGHSK